MNVRSRAVSILLLLVSLAACERPNDAQEDASTTNAGLAGPALESAYDYWQTLPPNALVIIEGGEVVAEGTPETIAKNKNSLTGNFLREELI